MMNSEISPFSGTNICANVGGVLLADRWTGGVDSGVTYMHAFDVTQLHAVKREC